MGDQYFAFRSLIRPTIYISSLAAIVIAATVPAAAGLLGTQMTMTLQIPSNNMTFFGPTTTTVIDPGIEFSIAGGHANNGADVDFTDSTMTIRFGVTNWNPDPLVFIFQSATEGAFTHAHLDSNSFPGASFSNSSTDLSFSCCSGLQGPIPVTDYSVVFSGLGSAAIPEPAGIAVLGAGLAGIIVRRRRPSPRREAAE